MPGILPMKVIKVGSNAQSRIAQACDRCRSKKIRCDGIRPCCSQCSNVGFECKTSDKLSRRAFPRGYTESLEERVRGLEAEVRELKELLDEKDEKIDMLSRIHSRSLQSIHLSSPRRSSDGSVDSNRPDRAAEPEDETFQVQQSPMLLDEEGCDSYFSGTSSTRTFVDAFRQRLQEQRNVTENVDVNLLLSSGPRKATELPDTPPQSPVAHQSPPRLVSDQLVNIFFQEWAPLFPILHRPTFLSLYGKYTQNGESVTDKADIAQLNLVFGIAAVSSRTQSAAEVESFESQWKSALDTIVNDGSMSTLQCLILAQLYCVQSGDFARLLTYKGLSTTLSARLGLHQSQKRFALGTLTCETRKKVFWTLYTLDSFTAVTLGLPKHIKDDDVHCEYPVDADDEYTTESGFQPTLPGEMTKVSSALALFRVARLLSKILEEIFPAKTSYDLSLKRLGELSDELDSWHNTLAPHLRMQFTRDKPSTGTVNSRSPLLSLTYHYIRALLQRPVLCASLGAKESPYMIAMAGSCKHLIQITQLLIERGLSFSMCMNQDELLILCGTGLLFQNLGLDKASKILKDNCKTVKSVVEMLAKSNGPSARELQRIVTLTSNGDKSSKSKTPQLSRQNSAGSANTTESESSTRKQLKAIASRFAANNSFKIRADHGSIHGKPAVNGITLHPRGTSSQNVPSLQPPTFNPSAASLTSDLSHSPPSVSARPAILNPVSRQKTTNSRSKTTARPTTEKLPNLDYLSFGIDADAPRSRTRTSLPLPVKSEPGPTDWEKLLGNLDNGETNIFDACYGGPPVEALLDMPKMRHASTAPASAIAEAAAAWDGELWALCQTDTETGFTPGQTWAEHSGSIFSFSTDEGGSSGEDLAADWASASSTTGHDSALGFAQIVRDDAELGFDECWDPNLSL